MRRAAVDGLAETVDHAAQQPRPHFHPGVLAARRHRVAQLQPVDFLERHGEHAAVAEADHLGADAPPAGGRDFAEIADGGVRPARFDQQADHFGHLPGPAKWRDAVELGHDRAPARCRSVMIVSAGGPPGRARFPAVANPPRHPGCRGRFRRSPLPARATGRRPLPPSLRSPPARRQAFTSAACDGCTLTREISWPWSFSSAAITSPRRASGSAAISRRMHPAGDRQRQVHHVGLGLPPQAGAQAGDFLDGARQALDHRLQFGGGAVPARRFPLPASPPRGLRGPSAGTALPVAPSGLAGIRRRVAGGLRRLPAGAHLAPRQRADRAAHRRAGNLRRHTAPRPCPSGSPRLPLPTGARWR